MRRQRALETIVLILIILSAIGWLGFGNEKPIARFTAATTPEGAGNLTILLDATASQDPDGQIVSYQWLFGDGYTGSGITKTHTYQAPGDYQVTLMLFDNGGERERGRHDHRAYHWRSYHCVARGESERPRGDGDRPSSP